MWDELAGAVYFALRQTKEPIAVTIPLLWHLNDKPSSTAQRATGASANTERWHDVPLFTFDKHTRVGKAACRMLLRECPEVRDTVLNFVPSGQAQRVVEMAAFYADATPINNRMAWHFSDSLEELGRETDFRKIGCPQDGIEHIAAVVKGHLDWLNDCRRRILDSTLG